MLVLFLCLAAGRGKVGGSSSCLWLWCAGPAQPAAAGACAGGSQCCRPLQQRGAAAQEGSRHSAAATSWWCVEGAELTAQLLQPGFDAMPAQLMGTHLHQYNFGINRVPVQQQHTQTQLHHNVVITGNPETSAGVALRSRVTGYHAPTRQPPVVLMRQPLPAGATSVLRALLCHT